uniref:Uncharacterized protein n=1 Tax=Sphaerodactylus townsendi TaxID=933632 RepID=A0ACB8FK42_9SAUR
MPLKKDTVLSSEEESDEASYGRQTPDKQSGEEDSSPERARSAAAATGKTRKKTSSKDSVSRQKKEARKMAAADHDGAGSAPEGPQCLVIPGQGLESQAAPSEDQTMTEVQDEGKLSLKDLKSEIFSYVKGAFQQEKASMREEMLALYREQVYQPSSPPNSSRTSPNRQVIPAANSRENKRPNPTWQTKAALKKPRLSPALGADDSSDAESQSREEGEVLSDLEELEEIQVTEQSSRLFKNEDYQYLLSKAVSALHLGEAKSGEGTSKRKSTSLHKGDGKYFPSKAHLKKVFPFPEYFETQVTNEWDKPTANRRCPNFLRKLYALPSYANDILQVPIIDGPVAALQSTGAVSKDDSVTFAARAMASSVAARRLLWLRAWQTDWKSKALVCECAFQGQKLFRDELNDFLVDPKEKPKHLPKSFRKFDRKTSSSTNFRPYQSQTFQPSFNQGKRDFRRPYWNQSRQPFKRGFAPRKQQGNDRSFQENRNTKA